MKNTYQRNLLLLTVVFSAAFFCSIGSAVTSKVVRHSSAADMLKGTVEGTMIDSDGTITLARQRKEIDTGDLLKEVWTINAVVADSKGAVYAGTSPNGDILKYDGGEVTRIYPAERDESGQSTFTNEHVFAMATDKAGRLLAAISGDDCRLVRFDDGESEVLFRPEGDMYIFAVTLDEVGNIYLGTGPNGRIYRFDPFGQNSEIVYECRDKNILSLAVDKEGFVYAGSDGRGVIYKINQAESSASVLYDSEQDEITALLFDGNGNLYAAATSAQAGTQKVQYSSISSDDSSGKPDTEGNEEKNSSEAGGGVALKPANTADSEEGDKAKKPSQPKRGELPKTAGHIYKIDPEGFVTDVFGEMAVFFAMGWQGEKLLLGTGNNAELFMIDSQTEQKAVAYEDTASAQITALAVVDDKVFVGCANPAKLVSLSGSYGREGVYFSELIDAEQPAKWGKLQVDARIPAGCSILLSARSGNVKDPNDPTFSSWSEEVEVTEAVGLECPNGRFCQYRLTLRTSDSALTPIIREVTTSSVVPNLAPKLLSVEVTRTKDKNKSNFLYVGYTSSDDNKDKLVYEIEYRKAGRSGWILLKEDFLGVKLDWDTNTVEDGRYEVRVTASDRLNNTTATALTTSRISEQFVVDNSAPEIKSSDVLIDDDAVTVDLQVEDVYTAIGSVSYTVDSDTDWTGTLPDDMVYDTTAEDFTILIKDLKTGEHVIALQISDDIGNTMYKTLEVEIE